MDADNGFQLYSDSSLSSIVKSNAPLSNPDVLIYSQGLIAITSGNITVDQALNLQTTGLQGEIRLFGTLLWSLNYTSLECHGNLWLVNSTNITGPQVYIYSNQSIHILGEIQISNPQILTDLNSKLKIFGNQTIESNGWFTIKHYQRADIDSNNSISLGNGTYRVHNTDIKAKSYLKIRDLEIYQSRSIFLSAYNVTIRNCKLTQDQMQNRDNNTVIRLIAYHYLQVDSSSLKAGSLYMIGDYALVIIKSYVESLIQNTCNNGTDNLFYCIKRSSLDKDLSE